MGLWLCVSVQHECIPQAILSMDVLCQAKSGMGKTAVFVLATLQQLEPVDGQVRLLAIEEMFHWGYSSVFINDFSSIFAAVMIDQYVTEWVWYYIRALGTMARFCKSCHMGVMDEWRNECEGTCFVVCMSYIFILKKHVFTALIIPDILKVAFCSWLSFLPGNKRVTAVSLNFWYVSDIYGFGQIYF